MRQLHISDEKKNIQHEIIVQVLYYLLYNPQPILQLAFKNLYTYLTTT